MLKNLLLAVLATVSVLHVHAQQPTEGDTLEIQRNRENKVSFVRFNQSEDLKSKWKDEKSLLKGLLRVRDGVDELKTKSERSGSTGMVHRSYQQYYKSILVENAGYYTHSRDGAVESMNGSFYDIGDLSVTPAISEAAALQSALSAIGAKAYAWEDPGQELMIKSMKNDVKAS